MRGPLARRRPAARQPRAAPGAERRARARRRRLPAQREVVDAFFAAGRDGDFDGLVAVLDPDVVLRVDLGQRIEGAAAVAGQARLYGDREARHATVNGAAGAVIFVDGRATAVMAFTVVAARIVAIDVVADLARVRRLDLSFLD